MPEAAEATPTQTPSAPVVAEPSTAIDLDTYRKNGRKEVQAEAKPADAADADDDIDDDTAKAIDEIEKPADAETPQSRSARRRKHREAARKALVTKANNAREAAEAELREWREGKRTHQPTVETATPAKVDAPKADHTRPEPTLADFPLDKFKDADDPYQAQGAALARELVKWELEQRDHAAEQKRQADAAEADAKERDKALDQSEADARQRYADYDAVVGAARFPSTPASKYVRESIARSGVFGPLVYHLCKQPDTMRAILNSQTSREVDLALGAEIATVKAALKEKPSAPKVTATSEPVQPVTAGAGSSAVLRDPYKDSGTAIDLDEARAFRKAQGR